jgi:hypothetical protein
VVASAKIQKLIDKFDSSEIVRDQIAGILLAESESQQALANTAGKDSRLWVLRVFTEASNPWEQFRDKPDRNKAESLEDFAPVINVSFDQEAFDPSKSDASSQSHADAVINVDCYGYGLSRPGGAGHVPGDTDSALEAQRATRLARNILMASSWTTLGLTGLVGRRFVQSINSFHLPEGAQNAAHVRGVRIALGVSFNEYAPQYEGQPFAGATITVKRAETGQIYLVADINVPTP